MAVADPVEVGQRLSIPDLARRRSDFLVLGMSTRVLSDDDDDDEKIHEVLFWILGELKKESTNKSSHSYSTVPSLSV